MIRKKKRNFEIMTIFNIYKDVWDDFINSSNLKSSLRSIDKESYNIFRFKNSLTDFLEEDCLNKNILALNRLLRLAFKTRNF